MVKVAIFHEGKSIDKSFFELLLDELELDKNKVRFYGMGNKSNFFKIENTNYEDLLLEIDDTTIDKVLFILDSDYEKNDIVYDGYENTLREINSIREKLKIENKSDVFIAYDFNSIKKEGYLESLILSSIPKEQKECIKTFLDCSNFKAKNHHKSILNEIYKKAYPDTSYNFPDPYFTELKQKLQNLFNS
ncbi:MAG: hypothetical protein U9P72_05320 [Campylobacterota bacterium]|nr:hypothetical protein [Campylobacterota bacterium]